MIQKKIHVPKSDGLCNMTKMKLGVFLLDKYCREK